MSGPDVGARCGSGRGGCSGVDLPAALSPFDVLSGSVASSALVATPRQAGLLLHSPRNLAREANTMRLTLALPLFSLVMPSLSSLW